MTTSGTIRVTGHRRQHITLFGADGRQLLSTPVQRRETVEGAHLRFIAYLAEHNPGFVVVEATADDVPLGMEGLEEL